MKVTGISLRRILWGNRSISFSRGGDDAALAESIARVGLIDPPDLLRRGDRCVIIRGRRRLLALRRLRRGRVPANLYEENELSPLDAWSMNFHDTRSRRELNPAEACTAVLQLRDLGLGEETIVARYLPSLGLPRKPGAVAEYLTVALLENGILDDLAAFLLTLPTAAFLAALSGEDRGAAHRFLRRRPLTVGRQREWVRLVGDIAARDDLTVRALLASVSRAAARRAAPPGAAALEVLRERRYPALAARRKRFRNLVRRLKLPPSVRLATHPFFERHELTATVTAHDAASWRRALALLERAGSEAELQKMLGRGDAGKKRR